MKDDKTQRETRQGLVETGRVRQGGRIVAYEFKSSDDTITATVREREIRIRRNRGYMDDPETTISVAQLAAAVAAATHWLKHRLSWAAFVREVEVWAAGQSGCEKWIYRAAGGDDSHNSENLVAYRARGEPFRWEATFVPKRNLPKSPRDDEIFIGHEVERPLPSREDLGNGARVTHTLWHVGERGRPAEGDPIGLACDLPDGARFLGYRNSFKIAGRDKTLRLDERFRWKPPFDPHFVLAELYEAWRIEFGSEREPRQATGDFCL